MKRRSVLQAVGWLMALVGGGVAKASVDSVDAKVSFMVRALALARMIGDRDLVARTFRSLSRDLLFGMQMTIMPSDDEYDMISKIAWASGIGGPVNLDDRIDALTDTAKGMTCADLFRGLSWDDQRRIVMAIEELTKRSPGNGRRITMSETEPPLLGVHRLVSCDSIVVSWEGDGQLEAHEYAAIYQEWQRNGNKAFLCRGIEDAKFLALQLVNGSCNDCLV